MSNTLAQPLVNNSQVAKLERLTKEAKEKKNAFEKADKELKEYRDSLPISQGDTTIGKVNIKKSWVDGKEGFDLKKFREEHPEDGSMIQKTLRRVVEHYVKTGKGYFLYTLTRNG
jgi:hypothetical protein